MNLKIILIYLFTFTCITTSIAQDKVIYADIIITNATKNGNDISSDIIKNKLHTIFYSVGNKLFMANYSDLNNDKSWGEVWDVKYVITPEKGHNARKEVYDFKWNYKNSYDSNKGICSIHLTKEFEKNIVNSTMKIISDKDNITIYKGYLDNSDYIFNNNSEENANNASDGISEITSDDVSKN